MGLRFRKSIKIAPGLKINLNKDSVSATVGKRGAHYTINTKGKRTASVGIPGTGLSYTSTFGGTLKVADKGIVFSASEPGCSNMKNPTQVTKSEAEARGRTPCKKCY